MGDSESSSAVNAKTCGMLVLVYWLCCCMWYEDKSENPSRHPSRTEITHENGNRRRSSELFHRRIGSSAVSLHLPSTSGHKKSLAAHRSHEEIGRRKSQHENNETRYHSAPSVIDEVLHRRDWERSTKDLYIPLNPVRNSDASDSPDKPPHAEPESSSIECLKSDEQIAKPCKKHYTNIKSSKGKKVESNKEKESTSDDKDCDVTEQTDFYIGDTVEDSIKTYKTNNTEINNEVSESQSEVDNSLKVEEKSPKVVCKAKEAKQSLNESIRSKERPKPTLMTLAEHQHTFTFSLDEVIEQLDTLESLDRSGAIHHGIESRVSGTRSTYPPPSVEGKLRINLELSLHLATEAVGYDGCACYLSGDARVSAGSAESAGSAGVGAWRARHASDGDILAPPCRPESGAFSESDLDLDLEGGEERPPSYDELHQYASPQKKETAI